MDVSPVLSEAPLFVTPNPLFCHPERKRGVPRHWRASGGHGGKLSPLALFCHPGALFCHPEPFFVTPSPFLSPRAIFFVTPSPFLSPRAQARGPSALACLGRTSRDAVPSEARGASLSLGRTKNGRSAGQCRGDFFEQPPFPLDNHKKSPYF